MIPKSVLGSNPERAARRAGAVVAIQVLVAVLAGAVAFEVFQPALQGEFLNFDDRYLYLESPEYRGLDARHLAWMFKTTRLGHYAPLAWLSAALDDLAFGLAPYAFHRTNLLLHAANTALFGLLAMGLLRRTQPDRAAESPIALALASGAAALLFALHPLRVESVAWITERRGLLAAFFLLLALLAWLRACPPGRVALASKMWYALSLLALSASVLSKGLGMTFVAIVVVLDVCPLGRLPGRISEWGRKDLRALWLQKAPPLLLGTASAIVSAWAARSAGGTVRTLGQWGLPARIGQACYGLLFYLRETLWPASLSPMHELPYRFHPLEPRFLAAAVVVPVLVAALVLSRRHAPALAAAAAVYAIALAPVLGFAQAGPQVVADRYSYVACMPWAVLAGGALFALWNRFRSVIQRGATAVLLLALATLLSARTRREIACWRDSRTLWEHVIEVGEPSSIAHNNLGAMDGEAGFYDSAITHLLTSVAIRPDQGRAWLNLGLFYGKQNRIREAVPAYLEARKTLRPATDALVELGNLYLNRLNQLDDAIAVFREAVAEIESLDRTRFSPRPYLALGVALLRKGEVDEGRRHLEFASQFPETRELALRVLGR